MLKQMQPNYQSGQDIQRRQFVHEFNDMNQELMQRRDQQQEIEDYAKKLGDINQENARAYNQSQMMLNYQTQKIQELQEQQDMLQAQLELQRQKNAQLDQKYKNRLLNKKSYRNKTDQEYENLIMLQGLENAFVMVSSFLVLTSLQNKKGDDGFEAMLFGNKALQPTERLDPQIQPVNQQ